MEEARFAAGLILGGRYRVQTLLGRGGMGEVYRAQDLLLNQIVALKFLSDAIRTKESALVRFRSEVRIARQISHANVCRVYDIGVIEGLHFLSMEYVDGEDLSSLLRRIGRLPQAKALEISRRICAGLAAAHDRGVLHRDLKPANIMIDGRGHVRITDFGLAVLASEVPPKDLGSGTPAYMAPEQKSGREVTARSDIYSLGLVLYEMFTGTRCVDPQRSPVDLVKHLDPAIAGTITQCLQREPHDRPSSALAVAMALPGGDPVAAALAAGETPSPDMVAASDEKEGISPRHATICFLVFLTLLAAISLFSDTVTLLGHSPVEIPPDALAFKAREILTELGYTETPRTAAYGFLVAPENHSSGVIRFWYRQHQDYLNSQIFLTARRLIGPITSNFPPNTAPGMVRVILEPRGRLIALDARPSTATEASSSNMNWAILFRAAGLDPARFTAAVPKKIPPMAFDERSAWIGSYGGDPTHTMGVEAASWRGRPVFFDVAGLSEAAVIPSEAGASRVAAIFMFVAILVGSVLVARHNSQSGRVDRRGAARVAAAIFAVSMMKWLFTAGHVATSSEFYLLTMGLSWATFLLLLLWLIYLAVEPWVRRNWPDALISWTRLHTGRLRDRLVASHILVGLLAGLVFRALDIVFWAADNGLSRSPRLQLSPDIESLDSVRYLFGCAFRAVEWGAFAIAGFIFLVVLSRFLMRRIWLADVFVTLLIVVGAAGERASPWLVFIAILSFGSLWLLRRFGLLALIVSQLAYLVIQSLPVSLSSWYANYSLVALSITVCLGVWALSAILAQRPKYASNPLTTQDSVP